MTAHDIYSELIKLGYEPLLLQSLNNKELHELWQRVKGGSRE